MGYSYRTLLKKGEEILAENKIMAAKNDAWLLLSMVTGLDRTRYIMRSEDMVTKDEEKGFLDKINRRAKREPLQYIEGSAPFMGYDFAVNENVLIPRMDTEVLVMEALRVAKLKFSQRPIGEQIDVLDMCTGSGCIIESIYLKLNEKGYRVRAVASDISAKALAVAKENARRLGASVEFLEGDLFEKVTGKFEIITSNPPYICTSVIADLEPEVKDYEPMLALDGTDDGLYFYRKIVINAREHLTDDGYLIMEIGYDQGLDVSELCKEAGYSEVMVLNDFAGLDRVVVAHF